MRTEAADRPTAEADERRSTVASGVESTVPFPRYSVALVQNESEMLQAPSYDLHTFLEQDPVFDAELFTERSFHALPGEDGRFDCVVIGYNAAMKGDLIKKALAEHPPPTGLCILHQFAQDGLSVLKDDVHAEFKYLGGGVEGVHVAGGRHPQDEILLHWPERVELDERGLPDALVYCGLQPGPESRWRTVLEVVHGGRSHPALLRTPTGRKNAVVICTALLSQARENHAALLRNIITWCAAGRPDVVVLQAPGDARAATVHRKLRLQGSKAIAHQVASPSQLDFSSWPLRGIANVVLPLGWEPDELGGAGEVTGLREWLEHDGRIVSIEDGGNLVIRHGASDARWVARQWGIWFAGQPPAGWQGRIVRTRAVLRALVELRRGMDDGTAERLGLPAPKQYAESCTELLQARLGGRRGTNCDGTVSATTAALEIDRAIGGRALWRVQRGAVERWLRTRATEKDEQGRPLLAAEDRLEVARCLGDGPLALEVAEDLIEERGDPNRKEPVKPLPAILVTKLREAAVAGGLRPGDIREELAAADRSIEPDVRESPLLAANYLIALHQIQREWDDSSDPLANEPHPEAIDRVMIAIGKHGVLVKGRATAVEHPHELVSAEALALLAYFERNKAPTHVLPGAGATPPELIASLVREARELRGQNVALPGLERAVAWAKRIVGLLAVAVVVAVSAIVERAGFVIPGLGDLTIPSVALALLLAAAWGLSRIGLLADWFGLLTDWMRERVGLSRGEGPRAEAGRPEQQPEAAGPKQE